MHQKRRRRKERACLISEVPPFLLLHPRGKRGRRKIEAGVAVVRTIFLGKKKLWENGLLWEYRASQILLWRKKKYEKSFFPLPSFAGIARTNIDLLVLLGRRETRKGTTVLRFIYFPCKFGAKTVGFFPFRT